MIHRKRFRNTKRRRVLDYQRFTFNGFNEWQLELERDIFSCVTGNEENGNPYHDVYFWVIKDVPTFRDFVEVPPTDQSH
ncbi:MAG: hypothetical protein V4501_12280 [Pseudomonadota bacterium]